MIVRCDRRSLVVSTLAVVFLGSAAIAWGHGFSRGGFDRPGVAGPRGRGPHGGGFLKRLIFPCQGECFDAVRGCHEAAESAAVTCAEQACATEIGTARTACATDVTTGDCEAARGALLECAQPCLTTKRSADTVCRTTFEECVDACGGSGGE